MAVDKDRAYELRELGMTFREMAIELGCSEVHLRTMLTGVPRGKKYVPATVQEELKRISKELSDLSKRCNGDDLS